MQRQILPKLTAAAALLVAVFAPTIIRAQEYPDAEPQEQTGPPGPAVARLSILNGDVNVLRGDSGTWVAAAINAPVMAGDHVAAGPGSRAELQFDYANLLRIGSGAEIQIARLDYGQIEVQLARGTVTYRVLRDSRAQAAIDTPTVSVRPNGIGVYRIYVKEDGQTEVTVRAGSAEVYTPQGSQPLQAGQTLLARGDPANPEFRIVAAIGFDEWDRWNDQRDRELQRAGSYQYVPQEEYGAEDLDQYGHWVDVPEYGEVWSPEVGPDWAPYQNGSWAWEGDYGWTWVSYDPWGWAPYHWGRWFYAAPYGWCWHPGLFGYPYWSPGLVAFFGFGGGGGFGVGFGFGNIGWVPLAPFERCHPWWGGHGFYGGFRGVHIENVNIYNTYRNARTVNGVAGVRVNDFQQGRFSNISRVNATQIRQAGLVQGSLPVVPGAANLRYTARPVRNAPPSVSNVRYFTRNGMPPVQRPVQRTPFSQQQSAMQQLSRQAAPSAGGSRFGTPAAPAASGWRNLNQAPARPSAPVAAARSNSGWSRFGEPRSPAPVSRPQNSFEPPRPGGGWQSSAPAYRPPAQPQHYQSYPNYSSPQSIRVAPPIVRERPVPSMPRSEPSRPSDGGSYGYRAPVEAPHYYGGSSAYRAPVQTPHYQNYSQPRSNGSYYGGGGGSYHSSGGGGSYHSSGGGGSYHSSGGGGSSHSSGGSSHGGSHR